MLQTLNFTLVHAGINLKIAFRALKGIRPFFKDKCEIKKQARNSDWTFGRTIPCLYDRFEEGGIASGHYFNQDLLVAQLIHQHNPIKHVDIGSRIDGFVAHVASFRKIELIDIRLISAQVHNIVFKQANLMEENTALVNYCDSLSCLHALEHFGLGRYGDPVDIDGHLKGFSNMAKMVQPNGRFYFSTPIGHQRRIEFNGQRVFDIPYLLKMFGSDFKVDSFHYVDDLGALHTDVAFTDTLIKNTLNLTYGCGIFVLIKN